MDIGRNSMEMYVNKLNNETENVIDTYGFEIRH